MLCWLQEGFKIFETMAGYIVLGVSMILNYALDIGKLGLLCLGVSVFFYYLYGRCL